jgi:hypothetical protein
VTDETRAAIGRVRQFLTTQDVRSAYAAGDVPRLPVGDLLLVADAYCAVFGADDETPVDEDWLRAVGGERPMAPAGDCVVVLGKYRNGFHQLRFHYHPKPGLWDVWYRSEQVQFAGRLTRRMVRRLAVALRVHLRELPDASPPP